MRRYAATYIYTPKPEPPWPCPNPPLPSLAQVLDRGPRLLNTVVPILNLYRYFLHHALFLKPRSTLALSSLEPQVVAAEVF